ncbi:unnamed protein product [Acanthoscelides obtectus]|uniref:Uncharacterized protein n=1 Tax=Acanthoscelides obtectus TaxID=200917 RepID=A0A9P0JZY1_ACAOB|nr:unnamed protein product [Acanthoscelides obtectus]CAK1649383.1 hypothetical protein AOBTE_LOCUS16203 [Acanthoscelides obtectus]
MRAIQSKLLQELQIRPNSANWLVCLTTNVLTLHYSIADSDNLEQL